MYIIIYKTKRKRCEVIVIIEYSTKKENKENN